MAVKKIPTPQDDDKRFYWLRLHKDFFKRHDTRIIEAMPNGKDYLLFYLKLLTESIDHMGELRFSDTIPYDLNMLATITNTNVDIVRTAIKVFSELRLVEVIDDGTFYMTQVETMMGSETVWAEKKRKYRQHKQIEARTLSGQKEDMSDKSKRESKSKRENINTPILAPSFEVFEDPEESFEDPIPSPVPTRLQRPTLDQVIAYCKERGNPVDPHKWFNHYTANGWKVGKVPMRDWQATVRTWEPEGFSVPKQPKKINLKTCPKCGTQQTEDDIKSGDLFCTSCKKWSFEGNGEIN